MAEQSSIIFISGGVRSGKSSFAEKLAAQYAGQVPGRLHYLAAGQPSDREMQERITRHQNDRSASGLDWSTWEQPRYLSRLSHLFSSDDVILLDCLTTLLNNHFFNEEEKGSDPDFLRTIQRTISHDIDVLAQNCRALIVVSNEVLSEPLADNELVFTYARVLGQLHQSIVKKSRSAYLVEAGIPVLMKGGEKE
ncbi:MAG TPA: cobinamide kinase [Bacillus bacterium]|nr:cobinamide kinase [Bacillus sp. (in: firmicutes)]